MKSCFAKRGLVLMLPVLFIVAFMPSLHAGDGTAANLPDGPANAQSIPSDAQWPKAVSKAKVAIVPVVPPQGTFSHSAEIQPAQMNAFRRISREGTFMREASKNDFGAKLQGIFQSQNDQIGGPLICNTVVTIFPSGH